MMNETKLNLRPHQGQSVLTSGRPLAQAQAAMILVHGRGATAASILDLADLLPHPDMVYLAPQAADNTWYPYSFLSPLAQNEPGLSSGLQVLEEMVKQVAAAGIPLARIILAGFSQGACLISEFAARHAQRYGGLLVFSGGLIGPPGTPRTYPGSLQSTPVFLGCSDVDMHIPQARAQESAELFTRLGAVVTMRLYAGMGHTIVADEIKEANKIVNLLRD